MLRRFLRSIIVGVYRLSTIGMKKEFPFIRHAMYTRLRELGPGLPKQSGDVLSISYSKHLLKIMGITDTVVTEANYPEQNILNLPYPDASFDFVVSDQVFEHIEGSPQQAIDECLRVLRPGGVMIHTTCFYLPHHPPDFWRFSTEGLSHLCRNASQIVESGGWGHPFVPFIAAFGFVWEPAPAARWHPMNWAATYRWASYDYLTWVVAIK